MLPTNNGEGRSINIATTPLADSDIYRHNPWRAPGFAPVASARPPPLPPLLLLLLPLLLLLFLRVRMPSPVLLPVMWCVAVGTHPVLLPPARCTTCTGRRTCRRGSIRVFTHAFCHADDVTHRHADLQAGIRTVQTVGPPCILSSPHAHSSSHHAPCTEWTVGPEAGDWLLHRNRTHRSEWTVGPEAGDWLLHRNRTCRPSH
jgi:hypothetical protein